MVATIKMAMIQYPFPNVYTKKREETVIKKTKIKVMLSNAIYQFFPTS